MNEVNCYVSVYNRRYGWQGQLIENTTPNWSGPAFVEWNEVIMPDHSRRGLGKLRDTEISKGTLFIFENIEINVGDKVVINGEEYKVWNVFRYIEPALSWRSGKFGHIEVMFR